MMLLALMLLLLLRSPRLPPTSGPLQAPVRQPPQAATPSYIIIMHTWCALYMLSRKSLEGGRFAGFVDSGRSRAEDIDAESVDPTNRRGLG